MTQSIESKSQHCKVTITIRQIEQRYGVPFEAHRIEIASDDGNNDSEFMNLFCGFVKSVTKILGERTSYSDSAELRYQSNRYSTISNGVEFRALAVRHGGLNGY